MCLVSIIFEATSCRPYKAPANFVNSDTQKGEDKLNWICVPLILFRILKVLDSYTEM